MRKNFTIEEKAATINALRGMKNAAIQQAHFAQMCEVYADSRMGEGIKAVRLVGEKFDELATWIEKIEFKMKL